MEHMQEEQRIRDTDSLEIRQLANGKLTYTLKVRDFGIWKEENQDKFIESVLKFKKKVESQLGVVSANDIGRA